MNNLLSQVSNQISERIKSIYGGTFVVMWLLVNWKILFYLTYMGKYRFWVLNEISNYISGDKGCWLLLWKPAFAALISIGLYGLFNSAGIAIISIFTLKVKPWLTEKIQKGSVVEYEDFKILHDSFKRLQNESEKSIAKFNTTEAQLSSTYQVLELEKKAREEDRKMCETRTANSETISKIFQSDLDILIRFFETYQLPWEKASDMLVQKFKQTIKYTLDDSGNYVRDKVQINFEKGYEFQQLRTPRTTLLKIINVRDGNRLLLAQNGQEFRGFSIESKYVFREAKSEL